jgi:hypothetical protein
MGIDLRGKYSAELVVLFPSNAAPNSSGINYLAYICRSFNTN